MIADRKELVCRIAYAVVGLLWSVGSQAINLDSLQQVEAREEGRLPKQMATLQVGLNTSEETSVGYEIDYHWYAFDYAGIGIGFELDDDYGNRPLIEKSDDDDYDPDRIVKFNIHPILIGEPGVGKSAIVEGLADRIAHHKVPRLLAGKRIVALDMASIVAGTQYRGQFEERLRRLIQELKEHPEIVLFMDEIHTIIGAGSAPGSLDAANMLKPALARGEVQCIGATTTAEFKKSIEKDGALDRRFQKVMLEPTSL